MYCFLCGVGRTAQVESVVFAHYLHVLQCLDLLCHFFGARCNLAKALLLAINGGRCENTGTVMVKNIPVLTSDTLNFEEVMSNYKKVLTEIARVYNEAMNIIHYMHDKYYYEKAQMALVDTNPRINLAYGVAGLSIALDSLWHI